MPTPIINSIISWFLKKRKHQIDLFLKYPIEVQEELLRELLKTGENTLYGKQYDFKHIDSYKAFAQRVPIVSYETIEPLIDRARRGEDGIFWPGKIKWFAKSSGTTNAKSKFIPVSSQALDDCHFKAGKDMLCLYINNNENAQLFTGKGLRLGGSSSIHEDKHSYFGDLSAIMIENLPLWADLGSAPKQKTALLGEWESKLDKIVEETIHENITSLIGVPSWMMVLINKVLERTGKDNILEVWPNLEVYFHGGVNFDPYREQYKKLIPKADFQYYENYNASEGYFAIQDQNNSNEMLLMLDYGVFYEFIPMTEFNGENSHAIDLSEVKVGENYAIVITTNSGLWRYLIGDTVKFTSTKPYRIQVTGRTKHFINAFGEELIIENTEKALRIATEKTQSEVTEYSVAPFFSLNKQAGSHEWMIEFKKEPENLEQFKRVLDSEIQNLNSDYEAKRFNDITLSAPIIHCAKQNLFYDWLKKKGKLGGQHKVPRLWNNREFISELIEMNES
ncbi:MAG: GH3 auxin-responsive promoter family protein [Flavobacteriaceae bacterium]